MGGEYLDFRTIPSNNQLPILQLSLSVAKNFQFHPLPEAYSHSLFTTSSHLILNFFSIGFSSSTACSSEFWLLRACPAYYNHPFLLVFKIFFSLCTLSLDIFLRLYSSVILSFVGPKISCNIFLSNINNLFSGTYNITILINIINVTGCLKRIINSG